MNEQRRFPWLPVLLGTGCLGAICIGVLVAGGGVAYFLTQRSATSSGPEAVVTVQVEFATILPEPTSAPIPTVIELTATNTGLTGGQRLDDHSLYDDFSSDALNWPVFDDGKTIVKYENEAYSFRVAEPDYYDWAYFPVEFTPYEIQFDVRGLPGQQEGTFGVFCQYQDEDNHYYAEFDLETDSYILAQALNGEDIPLTQQNTVGQYWYETSALKSPNEVNHIALSCYLDTITLFINGERVDEVHVLQPFETPGEAAFFVYAYDFAGDNGYKVFFDNVETWQPVQ